MCKYCDVTKYKNDWDGIKRLQIGWDCYTALEIWFNPSNNKFNMVAGGEGEVKIEINHCPICGRKLI